MKTIKEMMIGNLVSKICLAEDRIKKLKQTINYETETILILIQELKELDPVNEKIIEHERIITGQTLIKKP
jgi:hypothetical protein